MVDTDDIIRGILALVLKGDSLFIHDNLQTTDSKLQCHLCCIVAELLLLSARLRADGSSLLFSHHNQLYNKMSWWQSFHEAQVTESRKHKKRRPEQIFDSERARFNLLNENRSNG